MIFGRSFECRLLVSLRGAGTELEGGSQEPPPPSGHGGGKSGDPSGRGSIEEVQTAVVPVRSNI